jgi:hypothetical protein
MTDDHAGWLIQVATFPSHTAQVRAWLRVPKAELAGLWFLR